MQLLLHHFAALRNGKRGGKNVGDLKCDLRAIYTCCVSMCSANIGESWRGCASGVGSVCSVSLDLT